MKVRGSSFRQAARPSGGWASRSRTTTRPVKPRSRTAAMATAMSLTGQKPPATLGPAWWKPPSRLMAGSPGPQRPAGGVQRAAAGQPDGVHQLVGAEVGRIGAEDVGQPLGAAERLEEGRVVHAGQLRVGGAAGGAPPGLGDGLALSQPPGGEIGAPGVEPGEIDPGEGEPVGRVVPDVDLAPLEQAAGAGRGGPVGRRPSRGVTGYFAASGARGAATRSRRSRR